MSDEQGTPEIPAQINGVSNAAALPGRYNTKLVISITCGVAGVLLMLIIPLIGVLLIVTAILFAHLGSNEIKVTGERSRDLAVTALCIGYGAAIIFCLLLLAGLAGQGSRDMAPGQDSCVSSDGNFTDKQLQACANST